LQDNIKAALEEALNQGATYADARRVERQSQSIHTKNGHLEVLMDSSEDGVGIRVLHEGAWGFAATDESDRESLIRTAHRALRLARAAARTSRLKVRFPPRPERRGHYRTPVKKDPFAVPTEEKVRLLLWCDQAMRRVSGIRVAQGELNFWREHKWYYDTEGSEIEQEITHSGGGIYATARNGMELQTRSYPAALGGDYKSAGYEFIEALDFTAHAEEIAREAVALLDAPQCPSGRTTLILGGSQLALQVHESCGHPIELDRVFGTEQSFAGTSFLTPDKQGKFPYGSPQVNITADATLAGGLGTFGFDDEGIPACRTPIVEQGMFSHYISSRETAAMMDDDSNGAMRADGGHRLPLVRMTNISLEPGDWTLEEIIRDTEDGILMEYNRSWSIDEKRLNFQFGTELAYEIKNGSIGSLLKNATYTGITPEFWNGCDAVAGKKEWHLWGIPGCGKGEPMQVMRVGHGTAPARFRNVQVGVGKW